MIYIYFHHNITFNRSMFYNTAGFPNAHASAYSHLISTSFTNIKCPKTGTTTLTQPKQSYRRKTTPSALLHRSHTAIRTREEDHTRKDPPTGIHVLAEAVTEMVETGGNRKDACQAITTADSIRAEAAEDAGIMRAVPRTRCRWKSIRAKWAW